MNAIDSICSLCSQPFRWFAGREMLCPKCINKRIQQEVTIKAPRKVNLTKYLPNSGTKYPDVNNHSDPKMNYLLN